MSTEPAYSFEHRFEDTSEGGYDTWIVIKDDRGAGDPVATCYSAADALIVSDALNLALVSDVVDFVPKAYERKGGKPGNADFRGLPI